MAQKTFIKITNNDIYNSIQNLHKKHDVVLNCTTENRTQIEFIKKIVYASVLTASGLFGFLFQRLIGN